MIALRIPETTPRTMPSISAAANRRQNPDRSLVSPLVSWIIRVILTVAADERIG
jgi:hypothetical protein